MESLRARLREEEGVALILALAFLSIFGLWMSSLLTLSATDAKTTIVLRQVSADEYESDGAVQAAINYIRPNLEMARTGQRAWQCGSLTDSGASALSTATCTAGSGGVASGGTDNPSNHPARAILTLGSLGTENGFDHNAATGLSVHGGVYSTTNVANNASPRTTIEGDLTAKTTCTGTMTSLMPPLHCSDSLSVTDPNYLGSITPGLGKKPAAACPVSPAWLIDFKPGHYDDATQLNTVSTCASSILWFEPGVYVFDFQNAGTHVWTVNLPSTSNMVGGTEKGWANGGGAGAKPSVSFPGGCKTGFDATPNTGVQFIFGGDSQFLESGGKVELCATPNAAAQQIAVYGLKTSSTPTLGPSRLTPTSETHTGTGTWSATANAFGDLDGSNASIASANNTELDTITLSTYNTFNVPSTATITAASVFFAHTDSSTSDVTSVTITPGGAAACAAISGTSSTSAHTNGSAGNATSCLNTAAKVNGLTAKYSITVDKKNKIALLDGVVVDITYSITINAESGCATTQPYPSSGCAMLKTTGGSLAVQGTVYAPNAALDITLASVDYVVFARGIISRIFKSAIVTAGGYTGDEILVPDDCPYGVTTQNPTACTAGTRTDRTLTISVVLAGITKVLAAVTFVDGASGSGTQSSPITAGATVTITGWSVNR